MCFVACFVSQVSCSLYCVSGLLSRGACFVCLVLCCWLPVRCSVYPVACFLLVVVERAPCFLLLVSCFLPLGLFGPRSAEVAGQGGGYQAKSRARVAYAGRQWPML